LEDFIDPNHPVRVVNQVIDTIDIDPLIAKYTGGGCSSYHPRFRSDRLKEVLKEVFSQVVLLLIKSGHVNLKEVSSKTTGTLEDLGSGGWKKWRSRLDCSQLPTTLQRWLDRGCPLLKSMS